MKRKNSQVWDALIMILQFGINMIVPILLCTLLGVWLGQKTGHTWIVIPLFFMGALAGGTNIYRMVKKYLQAHDRDRNHVKKTE